MNIQEKIHTLFEPKSVAIVGASRSIGKWGFTFLLHLVKGGFKGDIYPVNPTMDVLLGKKVFKSLSDIPGPVDVAYILLPPGQVAQTVSECGRLGIPACVVITAGFRELGPGGQKLENEVADAAERAGVAMVGPNCAGITSPRPMGLYCMMQPNFPPPGNLAMVSQSGNLAGSLQHMCWKQDIGISRCVSVGNQARLTTEDFLEYLIEDDQSKVVLAYIESVSDGRRFMEVSRRLTRKKPFVVLKGGKTETGGRAARSHTGALAGSDGVFEAMCRQCGIIRADDLEDMFEVAVALLSQPLPENNRVGIIANGGGWGVIMADACSRAGLDVASLSEETLKSLDERLPPWWNRQNPVDLVAGMSRGAFFKSMEILCRTDEIGSLIALGYGYGKPFSDLIKTLPEDNGMNPLEYVKNAIHSDQRGMDFILNIIEKYRKPVLLCSEYGVGVDKDENTPILELRRKNILSCPSAVRTASILSRLAEYGKYRLQQG